MHGKRDHRLFPEIVDTFNVASCAEGPAASTRALVPDGPHCVLVSPIPVVRGVLPRLVVRVIRKVFDIIKDGLLGDDQPEYSFGLVDSEVRESSLSIDSIVKRVVVEFPNGDHVPEVDSKSIQLDCIRLILLPILEGVGFELVVAFEEAGVGHQEKCQQDYQKSH